MFKLMLKSKFVIYMVYLHVDVNVNDDGYAMTCLLLIDA